MLVPCASSLKTRPFFEKFDYSDIYADKTGMPTDVLDPNEANAKAAALDPEVRAALLVEAIPALSFATGRNNFNKKWISESNEIDMSTLKNGWPNRAEGKYPDRWTHSDIFNVDYIHNYKVYDKLVEQLGMK